MSGDTEVPSALSWTREGTVVTIRLCGAVDRELNGPLDALVHVVAGTFDAAVVDLEEVTFFGSTGINFLARLAAGGGHIQLRGMPLQLAIPRQLRATGLDLLIR
jgi:anti-anti-sigma regulatory factor